MPSFAELCIGAMMSSMVEGDEGSYLPNCQSNLVIALDELSLLFCIFINTAAYNWADISLHLPLAVKLPGSANQSAPNKGSVFYGCKGSG